MGFFFVGPTVEATLFSPVEGKITLNGKPAAGAKLRLYIAWKDNTEETFNYVADASGFFKIHRHSTTYRQTILAQLMITQMIIVEYSGSSHDVWLFSKKEPGDYAELNGKPINLVRELTNEERVIRGNGSLGGTLCTWESLNETIEG